MRPGPFHMKASFAHKLFLQSWVRCGYYHLHHNQRTALFLHLGDIIWTRCFVHQSESLAHGTVLAIWWHSCMDRSSSLLATQFAFSVALVIWRNHWFAVMFLQSGEIICISCFLSSGEIFSDTICMGRGSCHLWRHNLHATWLLSFCEIICTCMWHCSCFQATLFALSVVYFIRRNHLRMALFLQSESGVTVVLRRYQMHATNLI